MYIFPKPFMVDHTVSVSINNIDKRIELNDPVVLFWDHVDRPEDWCQPEAKLYEHRYDLSHILEKNDHRRGDP